MYRILPSAPKKQAIEIGLYTAYAQWVKLRITGNHSMFLGA
jgi:hypothetical protein